MSDPGTLEQTGRDDAADSRTRLSAYMLLCLTSLFWGGNAIAGRMAVDEISPMTLTCVRWALVAVLFGYWLRKPIRQAMPVLRRHWVRISLMGTFGFTAFNGLYYLAAHYTSAMNILILQGSIPMLVLLGALVINRVGITPFQMVGMAITFVGVGFVATRGRVETLLGLEFNFGDTLMLVACLIQAGYVLSLGRKPQLDSLVLLFAMAMAAFVTSLPLLAYEVHSGFAVWPSATGLAILLYVTVFPSTLAQLFFMRGVSLIGPGRAGLFINLVPVFGALLAVAILAEVPAVYHLIALVCVVGGILLAEARVAPNLAKGGRS